MTHVLLKERPDLAFLPEDEKKVIQNQRLYNAIWSSKDPALAKEILLLEEVDVNISPFGKGRLLLHYAAQFGLTDVIEILLEKGADVNAATDDGMTPLHYLANSDDLNQSAALMLLENGADAHIVNGDGKTAEQLAKSMLDEYLPKPLYKERESFITLLQKYNAPAKVSNTEKLHRAAETGNLLLFRKCAADTAFEQHALKLCAAVCEKGDNGNDRYEIAKLCLPYIKDLNATDETTKSTLLNLCARSNQAKLATLLIDHGASVDYADSSERTPLQHAILHNSNETVTILIERGANISGRKGTNYLNEAIRQKNKTNAYRLIDASVELDTKSGHTPLQVAVEYAQFAIVQRLLEKGADPNIKTDELHYPLTLAVKKKHEAIAHLLLLRGANPDLSLDRRFKIKDLAARSKNTNIAALFALTPQKLMAHKPVKKALQFTNRRLLFEDGVKQWNAVIKVQLKKTFNHMTRDKIKEQVGEIEYFHIVNESSKGVYQLLLFNTGAGVLYNYGKSTIAGTISQHKFAIIRKMSTRSKAELREMLDDAYRNFSGEILQHVDFMKA